MWNFTRPRTSGSVELSSVNATSSSVETVPTCLDTDQLATDAPVKFILLEEANFPSAITQYLAVKVHASHSPAAGSSPPCFTSGTFTWLGAGGEEAAFYQLRGHLKELVLWSAALYRAAHTQLLRDSLYDPRTKDSQREEGVNKEEAALRRRPDVLLADLAVFVFFLPVCGHRSKASGPLHLPRPQPW